MARPDRTQFLSLPLQVGGRFDQVPDVRGAIDALDMGQFRNAALLSDVMLKDDRIQGVLKTRVGALISSPVEMEPGMDRARARRYAREIGGTEGEPGLWHDICPNSAIGDVVRWGIMVGVGLAQIVWYRTADRWTPRLIPWHPQFLRWDDWSARFKLQTLNAGEIDLPRIDETPEGDSRWLLWCPYGYRYGWLNSAVRWLADKYVMRGWTYRDWARYCEVHGLPKMAAFVPAGAVKEDADAFMTDLVDGHGEQVIKLPVGEGGREAGWGVQMLEATARTYDAFRLFKEALDTDIAVGLLGQNLTTEAQGGGLGGGEAKTHNIIRIDKALEDAGVDQALHQQLFTHDARFNYADDAIAPRPKHCVEPAEDEGKEADALGKVGLAALQLAEANPKTDIDALFERFGIPMRTPEELAAEASAGITDALSLTPSAQGAIVTVNEARRSIGLGPMTTPTGAEDPDGYLSIAEYQVKHADIIARAAQSGAPAGNGGDGGDDPPDGGDGGGVGGDDGAAPPKRPKGTAKMSADLHEPVKRYSFQGLPIAVENQAGSVREWHDATGNETGHTTMLYDYGFIEGHMGSDGDEVDCYVGPHADAAHVYVVHQLRAPAFKVHDEDKVMLGFHGEAAARQAYADHRNDGEQAIAGVSVIPVERFKAQLSRRMGTGKIRAAADPDVRDTYESLLGLVERAGSAKMAARGPRAKARARLYADGLADKAIRRGGRLLGADVAALRGDIEEAADFQDLRRRIVARFKGMDPAKLADLVRRARLMAHLGGQASAVKRL